MITVLGTLVFITLKVQTLLSWHLNVSESDTKLFSSFVSSNYPGTGWQHCNMIDPIHGALTVDQGLCQTCNMSISTLSSNHHTRWVLFPCFRRRLMIHLMDLLSSPALIQSLFTCHLSASQLA